MMKQCPICQKMSVVEIQIGLTPTKDKQGKLYIQRVCHNYECNYRDLDFIKFIDKVE